jgi:hypothetical protein
MGFMIFGIGFGLIFGLGLFFLLILPALRERAAEEKSEQSAPSQRAEDDL